MPQSGGTGPRSMSQECNPVKKICPASRISEMLKNPGKTFIYNGTNYIYPERVGMIYNAGNNLLSHQQDINELIRAFKTVDTIVVQDCWWTASARWADIVLPAATTLERNDITSGGTYGIDKIFAMKQAILPVGERWMTSRFSATWAAMCGVEYAFTEGHTQLDYVKLAYEGSSAAAQVPWEKFWETGVAEIKVSEKACKWVRQGGFRTDPVKNPLHTPSGKVEMYSSTIDKMKLDDCPPMLKFLKPAEYLGNAKGGGLHVVSPHPFHRLHSQMANVESLCKLYAVQRRGPLVVNAQVRGIKNGDLVELYNSRGAIVVGAVLSENIMLGVVSIYEGGWPQLDSKGRCNNGLVNFFTSSRRASGLSQDTMADTCLAKLRKCTDPESPTRAFEPSKSVPRTVNFDQKFYGLERAIALKEKSMASLTPGEKIFYQCCTVCHGPRDPAQFNGTQWLEITQSMFPRADLDEGERKLVLDFLLKNAKP